MCHCHLHCLHQASNDNDNDNNNIESFDSLFIKTCFLIAIVMVMRQVKLINPIKVYGKFKEDRLQLINDQRNKAGIYCLVNLINGHTYIGSSTNIQVRMRNYLNNLFFLCF